MRKLLATKEFKTELTREYSYTPVLEQLGIATNTMELWVGDDGSGAINWKWELEDESDWGVEDIGLWWDFDKNITDYDGVFELPLEAIELLKENGFNSL